MITLHNITVDNFEALSHTLAIVMLVTTSHRQYFHLSPWDHTALLLLVS